jgi:hypothetical protein
MVEYKKKKLILQSGGTRNYYYKVSSDGKKKQVSKNEYLEKKGGTINENNKTLTLLALKEAYKKLSFHENKNYKGVLYKQIKDLELQILKNSDLNALLKFINSILEKIEWDEKEMHEEILKILADEFRLGHTQYINKISAEINALRQEDTIKLLERLVNFGEIYKNKKKILNDKTTSFIIMKLIEVIILRIARNKITVPNIYYNRIFDMPHDEVNSKKSQYNNNNQSLQTKFRRTFFHWSAI